MIEIFSENKLIEYGFSDDVIARLLTIGNRDNAQVINDKGHYLASAKDTKIYSGDDFFIVSETYLPFVFND